MTTWIIPSLIAACAALLAVTLLAIFLPDDDDRPDVGMDIFDPRQRGTHDDPTGEQVIAGMALLAATPARHNLTQPDEDPYEDWTHHPEPATVHIAPSPLAWRRTIGERADTAELTPPAPPARPLHKHGRPKGDLTLVFEGIAEHEGHPVADHGPDEHTRVLHVTPPVRGRQIGWLTAVTQ